ncbi:MAG: hypothetical protein Q6363_009860 [Candidatus Njordarchaeota archaeon]
MSEEEGLFIEFIEEQEVEAEYGFKNPRAITKGKIIIKNKTGGMLSDVELELKGFEGTNLEPKLFLGFIKDGEERIVEYDITKENLGVKIVEELQFPPDVPEPFALKCDPISIKSMFHISNEMEVPAKFTIEKVMPAPFKVSGQPSPQSGVFNTGEGKISWQDGSIDGGSESSLEIDIEMHPDSEQTFNSGEITYTWSAEEATLSGLRFGTITGIPKHSKKIVTDERVETPGIWDISIIITNNSKETISVGAVIEIRLGDLLTEVEGGKPIKGSIERRAPGIRVYDVVKLDPIKIAPGETGTLGPITIKSQDKPKIREELKFTIHPKVTYKVVSKGKIGDIPIPVVWGKVTRKVEVAHEEFYAGLTPDQIAAHAEEKLTNITEVYCTGSAGLDEIVIKDIIPEDIAPPPPGAVEVYISKRGETKVPDEILEITIEPEGSIPEEQNTLVVKITNISYYFDEPLINGERIWLKYNMTSIDPKEDKTYEFGSTVELRKVPASKARIISLEEIPKVTGLLAKRQISVEKEVEPAEEDWFEVKAKIINESKISVPQHIFTDRIPETFELDERSVNPPPEAIDILPEGGVLIRWKLSFAPGEEKIVSYKVKARVPEARIADLYAVYEE